MKCPRTIRYFRYMCSKILLSKLLPYISEANELATYTSYNISSNIHTFYLYTEYIRGTTKYVTRFARIYCACAFRSTVKIDQVCGRKFSITSTRWTGVGVNLSSITHLILECWPPSASGTGNYLRDFKISRKTSWHGVLSALVTLCEDTTLVTSQRPGNAELDDSFDVSTTRQLSIRSSYR